MTIIWWYGVSQTEFVVILDSFSPFPPPPPPHNNAENQNFEKLEKKCLEILSLRNTCVPLMTIIRCMVPEIWSTTDIIVCHFGPFLPFHRVAVKYETLHETRNKFGIQNTEKLIRNGKTQNISRTGRTVKHGTWWTWKY